MRGLVVLIAAAMFYAAAASGQVFHRCVDAEGKVTFSDRGCPTTAKPSIVEVKPNVADSAPLRQAVQDREAEERRRAAIERQRAMQQQRAGVQGQSQPTQGVSQEDRAQADAMLKEARDLRKQAADARSMSDRAALNRRAQGLEDSAGILRGVPPQRSEGVANTRNSIGQCMGGCASEQGICIAQCRGNGQCISHCAAAHGRCVARCN